MTDLSGRFLKLKSEQLIDACGGFEEASRACGEMGRPYKKSHLQRCQDRKNPANATCFLPVDIVAVLEAYCGQPIVSRAMAEARPAAPTVGALRDEIADMVERIGRITAMARAAEADDRIDPREGDELDAEMERLASDLEEARTSLALRRKGGR